jgi:hypothetical protein
VIERRSEKYCTIITSVGGINIIANAVAKPAQKPVIVSAPLSLAQKTLVVFRQPQNTITPLEAVEVAQDVSYFAETGRAGVSADPVAKFLKTN